MAQPESVSGLFWLIARKTSIGPSMPPTAARTGRVALETEDSAPSMISRLISSPTSRKKIAINRSLIHNRMGLLIAPSPKPTVK